jgi:deoxyadenosine/deoxycytidine kinase
MMDKMIIGVVGPCAAGKTTLINGLRSEGYMGKHIAQEHSYVKDMWIRMTNPDFLIYLDVSYEQTLVRRKLNWTKDEYYKQVYRLRHAKANADLLIDSDSYSSEQVLRRVVRYLSRISKN